MNADDVIDKLQKNGVFINYSDIIQLCKKYNIIELSIFGSSIRDDFAQDSDVDFLVSFEGGTEITLFDIIELEKESLKNPIRKDKILATREIIYAA